MLKSIGIFCGSSAGVNPVYMQAAKSIGSYFAENNLKIVYGGGKVGLMGAVADAALACGGQVIGVMPQALVEKEIAHTGLTELFVVKDMHERKQLMASLSDAFLTLPGGAGTLEEIFEQWTWAQLGIHQKPCAFFNVNRYFSPLLTMVSKMVEEGFLKNQYLEMLIVADDPSRLLVGFENYQVPKHKWQK
ncbi:LOG family protein [Martelella alba]|uniref:Cytokinin riboside 5'-monophosphate phosphoribohydrolase n=1 Tax=Martelella alba TaxID=2590451 RepID=A0ABY2SQ56_9HYPH|nr:TIGR00730 family Rossman fold protein [Martelella alba]TKI05974.1 TIGR00730 family Rossman fold protein [Martelella alba]